MGRTAKPRKKYRPKAVMFNGLQYTIESAQVLRADAVARTIECLRIARDDLLKGDMDQGWRAVADALNVATQLSDLGICSDEDSRNAIDSGHRALTLLHDRHRATGSPALKPAEVAALDAAIERHEIQLRYASRREYDLAVERTINKVRAALAGNAGPSVRVVGNLGTVITDHHTILDAIPQKEAA